MQLKPSSELELITDLIAQYDITVFTLKHNSLLDKRDILKNNNADIIC